MDLRPEGPARGLWSRWAAIDDRAVLQAYRVDIETRTNPDGPMRDAGRFPDAWKVNAHDIKAGVIYRDEKVTVTAFPTKHAMESYGYRFETPDRTIVISGDTNPVEETIKSCNGCDVLIHEAQPLELQAKMPQSIQSFVARYHTTTEQLAELANKAKPKLLVIYHTVSFPPGDRTSRTATAQRWCGRTLRLARNASKRDRFAIFREIRYRKRSRCVLAS